MEDNKYYLRVEDNGGFGFVLKGMHDIKKSDIKITNEEYDRFFELQSQGKQFKIKENPTGTGLFDYIEEYAPEVVEVIQEPGTEDRLLDTDFRLSKLELGV